MKTTCRRQVLRDACGNTMNPTSLHRGKKWAAFRVQQVHCRFSPMQLPMDRQTMKYIKAINLMSYLYLIPRQ